MAENVTLAPVASFTNDSSAVATVNANNALIETAFSDCLSLAGNQPNAMQSNIDMGTNQIINLPAPATLNSPVRLTDLANFSNSGTITLSSLPAGGSTNALLHKNSGTDYDATWTLTPTITSLTTTGNVTANVVLATDLLLVGFGSGNTQLVAESTASGVLTIPSATDTLVAQQTTDTLVNKTIDTAAPNTIKINGTALTAVTGTTGTTVNQQAPTINIPNITGSNGTTDAAAGSVGEIISSTIAAGSAVAITTGTFSPVTITSISLTAGDWDVNGQVSYLASAAAQTQHAFICSLSLVNNTADLTNGRYTSASGGGDTYTTAGLATLLTVSAGVPPVRFKVSTTTTVFLIGASLYGTSGTQGAYGTIRARRVR